MSQDSGDIEAAEKLTKAFNELSELIVLMRKEQKGNNTNTQTITLDAGGKLLWWALWIVTLCCVYMIGSTARMDDKVKQMQDRQLEDSRRLEADADRLSILLQWAPALRDEVNREMQKRRGK